MREPMRTVLLAALLLPLIVVTGMHLRAEQDPLSPVPWDPDMISLQINSAPKDAEIVFLGDSLVERWSYRQKLWHELCLPANLGVGGSRTANLLWLVRSAKLAPFHPKLWVILIGTNDLGPEPPRFWQRQPPTPERIALGISEVVKYLKERNPESRVLVTALPPRRGIMVHAVLETNLALRSRGLDVVDPWANDSVLSEDDFHLNDAGYEKWAQRLGQLIHCGPRS